MEATTIIVLKEVYLASWSKCLFRINSLFLIETSSHKSFLTSISDIFYLANPFVRYHILAFWFEYYIPSIILLFFYHNIFHEFILSDHQHILVFCIQLWRLEPKSLDPLGSCPSCCTVSNSDVFCSHSPWSGLLSSFFILHRGFYAWYILVNRVCHVIVYSFWGESQTLLCTLVPSYRIHHSPWSTVILWT